MKEIILDLLGFYRNLLSNIASLIFELSLKLQASLTLLNFSSLVINLGLKSIYQVCSSSQHNHIVFAQMYLLESIFELWEVAVFIEPYSFLITLSKFSKPPLTYFHLL